MSAMLLSIKPQYAEMIIKFSISKASLTKNPIPNTGRTISGKDSDEVIQQFGASLT